MKKIICILGMHRSGTSMLAHLIREMGVYFGEWDDLYEPSDYNPDGHFELRQIVDTHDEILSYYHRSWFDVDSFQMNMDDPFIEKEKEILKNCILANMNEQEYLGIKDPRMCLMLPLWNEIFLELDCQVKYIIICRNPVEVAKSLKRRDGLPYQYGEKLWHYYNNELFSNMDEKEIFLVTYDNLLRDEIWEKKIYQFVFEEPCPVEGSFQVINTRYRHEKVDKEIGEEKLMPSYIRLLGYAKGGLKSKEIEEIRTTWNKMCDYSFEIIGNRNDSDVLLLDNAELILSLGIIIYGAGRRGRIVYEQLCKAGITPKAFCDIAAHKLEGTGYDIPVISLNELERQAERETIVLIVSIENIEIADNARKILSLFPNVKIVSYYTVVKVIELYIQSRSNHSEMENVLIGLEEWYLEQRERICMLREALNADVVVYQNGKVGSNTILRSLKNAHVNSAHLHRIRFEEDIVRYILCDEKRYPELVKNISFSNDDVFLNGYIEALKKRENLKIISLVREPIGVDISTVFQWFDTDMLNQYIIRQSKSFSDVMHELIYKVKNRMFQWFDLEFQKVLGINIYDHPFDQKKGYINIRKDNMDILILQAERINELENVIGEFAGIKNFHVQSYNVASKKEYRQLYKDFIDNIRLPIEYVDFYYKGNQCMDFFYSKDDQMKFLDKWNKKTVRAGL